MNFIFGNVFWGILLLLWGLSLILKGFGIVDLPLVKIFLAVIIIMFGIKILVGGSCKVRFSNEGTRYVSASGNDYTTVFGTQNFDLTSLKPDSKPLDITAVFGSIYVELPEDIDFQINATNVFGSVNTPGKLGNVNYVNDKPVLIDATAVFGKVEIVYKASTRKSDSTVKTEKDSLQV